MVSLSKRNIYLGWKDNKPNLLWDKIISLSSELNLFTPLKINNIHDVGMVVSKVFTKLSNYNNIGFWGKLFT